MLEEGSIILNLIEGESVKLTKIQRLGIMYSLKFIGTQSNLESNKIISKEELDSLEIIGKEGEYSFKGDPQKFKLYAEAERINSAYQFDPLFAVNCSIIDPLPHQVEAVYKYLLPLPKIRFLLADDTGAGKTIMTGLLIKELMLRKMLERILIITPGGLTKQWQEDEMALKFNINFKLVNRAAYQADPSIFVTSNRLITSIDFIRNDDIMNTIKETSWDMIVVDEAHKLSAFNYGNKRYRSKRYQVMEELSSQCDHLLLLTATPHRGRKDTFKNLLQLLDEDIFASDDLVTARVKKISKDGVNRFFIRRLKEEMKDWEGNPLFKPRHTKTTMYELTPDEKNLYDKVTEYLSRKRREASAESNIHVSLALMVMQRRLTSSIYAVMKTLKHRYTALNGLLEELAKNPGLWSQKQKIDITMETLDDFNELDDDERESLEAIFADPRKFKMFTTAKNIDEIKEEASQVKYLFELAEELYNSKREEQKLKKLRELFRSEGILDRNEKIVIFTEHKDTLEYLQDRLLNSGYTVVCIHGGMTVDERREAQNSFARDSQILLATDAAGEGINLQFCRLMINWDIPWNPNRLEQRMGRIHRYGQKQDVLVFNLVAQNTREGSVLKKLLFKLDMIREQLGDDRVYDVISDIFENVSMEDIFNTTFNGENTEYSEAIEEEFTEANIKEKIEEKKKELGFSEVDYSDARHLKEDSDENRLQPIYIKLFFEKAFAALGGKYSEVRESIYRIEEMPLEIREELKISYNIHVDLKQVLFCFDKNVFLEYQSLKDIGTAHYINPGNPVFDTLIKVIRNKFRDEMIKGTILISPDDKKNYFAYYVKSQISDKRRQGSEESVADERLFIVYGNSKDNLEITSPAKFLDLQEPSVYAKSIAAPQSESTEKIEEWCFNNYTLKQYDKVKTIVGNDAIQRKEYLREAFENIIIDLTGELNDLNSKILFGDPNVEEKIRRKQQRIIELGEKRQKRLNQIELMQQLNMKKPEVLGCAYIVPLTQLEYKNHYGMSRDDEVEEIAMQIAMQFEIENGWKPEDVSSENAGYDIRSLNEYEIKRYIEVKGRSFSGAVMLSENEWNRLSQLGNSAWLYIVINCKSKPELYRIQNPGQKLIFDLRSKGVQYYLAEREWQAGALPQGS
ncbi:MAG: helicase-related protein [Candidatus Stygibacter australis]|nr:helicase-related protein [Candidatus Stygibacter australis]MDP8320768.1 helicase-related protein [Candidatus Stygibacter australis]